MWFNGGVTWRKPRQSVKCSSARSVGTSLRSGTSAEAAHSTGMGRAAQRNVVRGQAGIVTERSDGAIPCGRGTAWSGGPRRPRSAWRGTCPSVARKQHGPCKARWQRDRRAGAAREGRNRPRRGSVVARSVAVVVAAAAATARRSPERVGFPPSSPVLLRRPGDPYPLPETRILVSPQAAPLHDVRYPLGMLARSRRVWPTASLLTWRSLAGSTA